MDEIEKKTQSRKFLVVEDTEDCQELIKTIFRNYDFDLAADGQEAIDLAKSNDYFVILMDIKLPHVDGLEATRQIRTFNQEVPIIALTAYAMTSDRELAMKAGCTAHITKPFRTRVLIDLINSYLPK